MSRALEPSVKALTDKGTEDWYPLDRPSWSSQLAFFKDATGISDPASLRRHVQTVRRSAFAVAPYACIRGYTFLHGKVAQHPAYPSLVDLGRSDGPDRPFYIDLGCFLGVDVRQVVVDGGYPADSVLGVDLHGEYFRFGAKLFNDPPDRPPLIRLLSGDIFDPRFLDPSPLPPTRSSSSSSSDDSPLDLRTLRTLDPLVGRARAVSANSFFHLFDEPGQAALARLCAKLVSPRPGSLVFGSHVGMETKGHRPSSSDEGRTMFAHSPESFAALWHDAFGRPGLVAVDAWLRPVDRPDIGPDSTMLVWTVTVL